jgi:serine/threonine protein kinase
LKSFMNSVCNDPYVVPDNMKISQECKELLEKCFEKDAKKRIKIKDIRVHSCFDFLNPQLKKNTEFLVTKIMKYDNGVYEGEYKDDKINGKFTSEVRVIVLGKGVYKWADGKIYKGEWKDNK